jgi:hypothetical protein
MFLKLVRNVTHICKKILQICVKLEKSCLVGLAPGHTGHLHPGSEGVDDDDESVEGDDGQGQRRDVDGHALREGEEGAEEVAELGPIL